METLGRRPFRKGNRTGNEPRDRQLLGRALFRGWKLNPAFAAQATIGQASEQSPFRRSQSIVYFPCATRAVI